MLKYEVPLEIAQPFDGKALLRFFRRHAVAGVEAYRESSDDAGVRLDYARTLRLEHGSAVVELSCVAERFTAHVRLTDGRDYDAARDRIVGLCDLGHDVEPVERWLGRDLHLAPLVAASPGLRVPGTVDAHEHLFRTMIGQQISLAGAANCAAKLAVRFGEPFPAQPTGTSFGAGLLTRHFPTAAALSDADPATLPMPAARGRALVAVAEALASGDLQLNEGQDLAETRIRLLAQRGIGPWTADYVLMRALHHPDVLLVSDLVIGRELVRRGIVHTDQWSPWRSYATMHLWQAWTG